MEARYALLWQKWKGKGRRNDKEEFKINGKEELMLKPVWVKQQQFYYILLKKQFYYMLDQVGARKGRWETICTLVPFQKYVLQLRILTTKEILLMTKVEKGPWHKSKIPEATSVSPKNVGLDFFIKEVRSPQRRKRQLKKIAKA